MVSKRFLLVVVALATTLFLTSEIAAAKELASNHESEVKDKHDYDDNGYDTGGHGDYDNGGHGDYDNGGHGDYDNGGHGDYNNGHGGRGGYYNGGGRRGPYCGYGCCSSGDSDNRECVCCRTLAEATAYKQAHHN